MNDTHQSRRINQAGLDLVKEREGFFARHYICPAGKPSIGYGHVILAGEHFEEPISRDLGEELLRGDLAIAEEALGRLVKVALNDNQFSALVSFTFNVGQGNLQKSTLLKMLNAGDYAGAAEQFGRWIYADGKPLEGLKIRREMETALFNRPMAA